MTVNKRQRHSWDVCGLGPPQIWTEELHWSNGAVSCVTGNEACDRTAAAAPNSLRDTSPFLRKSDGIRTEL